MPLIAGALRSRPRLVILALLAVVAAATVAPAEARDAGGKRAKHRDAAPPRVALGRELVGLRTRTSKTFVNQRGGRHARIYAGPVHFRDARGRWKPIDSRLRRQGARFVNR